MSATFEGKADFTGATFEGNSDFTFAAFKGNAYFTFATFKRDANFEEATFKISTEFKGATFEGNANFEDTIFEGHTTYFTNAIFEGDANFFIVTFKGNANFEDVTFRGSANFMEATFEGDSDFRLKYLVKILNFSKIKTFSGKKLFIRLNNEGGEIFFERAYLENNYLDIELVEGILIDFTDALLRYTNIQREQIENHILQEEKEGFSQAQKVYLLLKNNFHSIGRYNDESWAFKKEKDMERFAYYKSGRHFKGVISSFLNFIHGYGEEPLKVLRFAIAVIIFFSFLYFNYGISQFVPEIRNIQYDFFKNICSGIANVKLFGSIIKNFPWRDYLNSLYFSLTTFATLAFGNMGPLTITSKIIAGIESFIGPFTIALFVYTFARKTGGR